MRRWTERSGRASPASDATATATATSGTARSSSSRPPIVSNRSSPEHSPERNPRDTAATGGASHRSHHHRHLKPLSTSSASHASASRTREGGSRHARSPDRRHQHHVNSSSARSGSGSSVQTTNGSSSVVNGSARHGSSSSGRGAARNNNSTAAASWDYDTTPANEKLAYFGSNESERNDSVDDDDGDASSSEDSATELLDAALGIARTHSPAQMGDASDGSGGAYLPRRELLVQRPVHENQHFVTSWENALLKPKRSSFASGNVSYIFGAGGVAGGASGSGSSSTGQADYFGGEAGHPAAPAGGPSRARSLTPGIYHHHHHHHQKQGNSASGLASRRKGSPATSIADAVPGGPLSRPSRSPAGSPLPASPPREDASQHMSRPKYFPFFARPPDFRSDLLPEVTLLTAALVLAAYRMAVLPMPDDLDGNPMPDLPLSPLIMLIFIIPGVSLFRSRGPQANYMFPFTDERGYRSPKTVDDGFAAGAILPVLLAAGFLWDAVVRGPQDLPYLGGSIRNLMDVWQAADLRPRPGSSIVHATNAQIYSTIVVARLSLLLSTSINSFILVFHIILSRTVLTVERLPTNNTKRLFGAFILSSSVSLLLWGLLALNDAFAWATPYISPLEAGVSSFIYQMSLYTVSRLVRRGFTLGELSLATGSGISLALEFWRLTSSRFFYVKHGGIPPTFRLPTPLVPYQHVMIPGAFLTGFLLAPLLVLSRNFAQRPSHRLKWPEERGRNRKWAALGIFSGLVVVVCLPFGGWAGWSLGGGLATAWTWAAKYALLGGDGVDGMSGGNFFQGWRRWRRIFLALYWLAIATAAVGGWQTRLVRARRLRLAKSKNSAKLGGGVDTSGIVNPRAMLDTVEIRDIRGNRRMHVALDLRRKFFHMLAVVMFVPAIAIDPAFTSLAFSLAFAIFTFAEYARYFAVYPIGAPIHVFFSEFVDSKDSGPVILSHFYLLTGCAGGLWLEGKGITRFTGVLAVGIGDAFASVLGKRIGIARWPNSSKTLFGTASFIASIFWMAMLLRATGMVESFSATRYLVATVLAGLLEAFSAQNDNLVIPIFFWSVLVLLEVG